METLPSLTIFGWLFTVCIALSVIIPYLRRTSDLLTVRNLFLIGAINFVGIETIRAGTTLRLAGDVTAMQSARFIVGASLFFFTFLTTYFYWSLPARAATRRWLSWAPIDRTPLFLIVAGTVFIGLCGLFVPVNISGLDVLYASFCRISLLIGFTLAFVAWYRDPFNIVLLGALVLAGGTYFVLAVSGGTGRHALLAGVAVVPISLYWLKFRYAPAGRTLLVLTTASIFGFLVLNSYSKVRHSTGLDRNLSSTERTIKRLSLIANDLFTLEGTTNHFDSQTTEYSLLAIRHYQSWSSIRPFFTVGFVLANPIPRAAWPDKPESLGTMLPRELGVWRWGYVNWGVGIVGHGYHEGGLVMLVIYGVVFGGACRFLDGVICRQAGNPYLVGMLCALAPPVISFSRGDIAVYTMDITAAIVTTLVLNRAGKAIFGTGLVYPKGDNAMPNASADLIEAQPWPTAR